MSSVETIRESNRELARKITEEVRSNPKSEFAGKFVGLANGKVAVVTTDLDELATRLLQIEPDPQRTFGFEPSVDESEPQYIWGLC